MNRSDTRVARSCRALAASAFLLGAIHTPAMAQDERDAPAWDDPPTWSADAPTEDPGGDDSWISVRAGLGFTADPGTFLMSVEVPFKIIDLISVGPQLRLGVSDDEVYFAPTVQAYITPRLRGDLDDLRPYASFGIGLAVLDKDDRRRGKDDDDVDFLMTPGFGVEYKFADQFFAGTAIQLDVIPGGIAGERFVFSWQVVTVRAAF